MIQSHLEDKTMTNFTKNIMIAAAALTIAAGVAGAQTIRAEIPFGFRAAGVMLPAGSYLVKGSYQSGATLVFKVTNEDTNRTVFTMPYSSDIEKSSAVSLTFECTGTDCTLIQAAPGTGQTYSFPKPRKEKNGETSLAVIRAVVVNAR
jgi:hypothetical protein